jgi:hypothetical protein
VVLVDQGESGMVSLAELIGKKRVVTFKTLRAFLTNVYSIKTLEDRGNLIEELIVYNQLQ